MKAKETVSPDTTKKPDFVDFIGIGVIRIAREVGMFQWEYVDCVSDAGDSAYLGRYPEAERFRLELWLPETVTVGKKEIVAKVLHKTFYTRSGGKVYSTERDLRQTGGEFEERLPEIREWQGAKWRVYTQDCPLQRKGDQHGSQRLVARENENNLYLLLCGDGGIQTFAFSLLYDQRHDFGLYVTVEQVWAGDVKRGERGKLVCHVLERKQGGSPALLKVVEEIYASRLHQLGEFDGVLPEREPEEKNTSGLEVWLDAQPPSGPRGDYAEVFCYMVSGPRALSFGRDQFGNQIYMNWHNVVGVEAPAIRRVEAGRIYICRIEAEPHMTFEGKRTKLFRATEITALSDKDNSKKLKELAEAGNEGWRRWSNWWDDDKEDNHRTVRERTKSSPRVVDRARRRRVFLKKPAPSLKPMVIELGSQFGGLLDSLTGQAK